MIYHPHTPYDRLVRSWLQLCIVYHCSCAEGVCKCTCYLPTEYLTNVFQVYHSQGHSLLSTVTNNHIKRIPSQRALIQPKAAYVARCTQK